MTLCELTNSFNYNKEIWIQERQKEVYAVHVGGLQTGPLEGKFKKQWNYPLIK